MSVNEEVAQELHKLVMKKKIYHEIESLCQA